MYIYFTIFKYKINIVFSSFLMEEVVKKKIEKGHTNISFFDNNVFIQEKVLDGFNHKTPLIDIENLNFDFVPKLISENDKEIRREFIDGESLYNFSKNDLEQIADNLLLLHNSKAKFAKNNIIDRVKKYRKILTSKSIKIKIIEDSYKLINNILSSMFTTTPIHGDLWQENIIKSTNNELFFIDWEYSHMGDHHYELAYFIESVGLNKEQEEIFLNKYDDYNEAYLIKHKILVNYLIILWIFSKDTKPFDETKVVKRLEELIDIWKKLKNN